MNNQSILILTAICILVVLLMAVPNSESFTGQSSSDPKIQSCVPANGQWFKPGGTQGSILNSPCCQPPNYQLGNEKPYKTCGDKLDPKVEAEKCVADCCSQVYNEQGNYAPSWAPMAKCACSLWCYNRNIPHFKKYGTAAHYITGDIAEAHTGDSGNFIGSGKGSFSGGSRSLPVQKA